MFVRDQDKNGARRAFREALQPDPDVELDSMVATPSCGVSSIMFGPVAVRRMEEAQTEMTTAMEIAMTAGAVGARL